MGLTWRMVRRDLGLRLGLVLAATFLWPACSAKGGPEERRPHNVVLLTLDTTRADHLSLYGYFRETSPHLDAFAREALVFERFIVPMATTLPTHISILTGTYPLEHGVLANSTPDGQRFIPSRHLQSFAALSQAAGYRTGAFVGAAPVKRGSGAELGFEHFNQPDARSRSATESTDAALEWLSGIGEAPFFLWIHYYDPHFPFLPPEGFNGLFEEDDGLEQFMRERHIAATAARPLFDRVDDVPRVTNRYDAEIRYMDSEISRVLDWLRSEDQWDETAVVIVGDHGEGLGQHGLAAHGASWNEQLHAPLIIRTPGCEPRRVSTLLSAHDVFPTLFGLVDLPQADAFLEQASGLDVLDPAFEERPVVSQDTGREPVEGASFRWALNSGPWKYFLIEHSDDRIEEELYHLGDDPYELRNIADERPDELALLRDALQNELATFRERGRELLGGEPNLQTADPAVLEQLRALGYIDD